MLLEDTAILRNMRLPVTQHYVSHILGSSSKYFQKHFHPNKLEKKTATRLYVVYLNVFFSFFKRSPVT